MNLAASLVFWGGAIQAISRQTAAGVAMTSQVLTQRRSLSRRSPEGEAGRRRAIAFFNAKIAKTIAKAQSHRKKKPPQHSAGALRCVVLVGYLLAAGVYQIGDE